MKKCISTNPILCYKFISSQRYFETEDASLLDDEIVEVLLEVYKKLRQEEDADAMNEMLDLYDEENEVYVKSASDEVSELREYRDGDSPRNIHWKRSSILAENDFIVKEYSTNINKTVFIVVDTDWRGEKSWRLSRMSRIYAEMMSQGLACAEAGLTGQYIVWDMAKADIVRVTFYDNASLKAAVKVVMDIRCGEGTVNKACQALYEDDRLEITTEPVIITEN